MYRRQHYLSLIAHGCSPMRLSYLFCDPDTTVLRIFLVIVGWQPVESETNPRLIEVFFFWEVLSTRHNSSLFQPHGWIWLDPT